MIVVVQCLRHRVVDDKGAGAIDQLHSSSRIAQTSASRLRVNEGQRCLGGLEAKLGRYVGISHDAQQEHEWREFRVRGSGHELRPQPSRLAQRVRRFAFFFRYFSRLGQTNFFQIRRTFHWFRLLTLLSSLAARLDSSLRWLEINRGSMRLMPSIRVDSFYPIAAIFGNSSLRPMPPSASSFMA